MNNDQAQQAAEQILANNPPGTEISFINEKGIPHNPHFSEENGLHSDGYHAVVQPDGKVSVDKFHVPDSGTGGNS